MDKNTLLLLFVLALLSSQLWNMTWNIGLSAFYLIIIIIGLNYISPDSSMIIKDNITKIINLDFSLFKDLFSYISKFILSIFSSYKTVTTEVGILDNKILENNLQDSILEKHNIEFRKL